MHVTPLASGSAGNATLVASGRTRILIDCGLPRTELEARLEQLGVRPRGIHAIFLSHRHRDHIRGTTEFAARHRIAIRGSRRTVRSIGSEARRRVHLLAVGGETRIGDLRVRSFALPHDAPETVGYRVWDRDTVLGHATDLGSWDDGVRDGLVRCHVVLLEFNHDVELLARSADPPRLRARIASPRGHLSNTDAGSLLDAIKWPGLRLVFVAHISRRNNTPERALAAARAAVGPEPQIVVARQDRPTATARFEAVRGPA